MKKYFFLAAIAAIGLASCSSDETIASQATSESNAIGFRALTNNMTRAADADLPTNGFRVTAFQTGTTGTSYFENVDFTSNAAGNYTSAEKYYWPSAYNLDFYAWSPGTLSTDYSSISVTPGTTIASQNDLIYATATNWGKQTGAGTNDGSNGVTINFRHAESKVIVKLKNTNSKLFFTVKDVKIGYLDASGTFAYTAGNSGATNPQNGGNLSNTDWTPDGSHSGVYQLADAASTSYNGAATQVGADMILIPQTLVAQTNYSGTAAGDGFNGAYILVEYKAQNVNSSGAYVVGGASEYVKAIWPLTSIQWVPGYKYTYTVDLAGGGYFEKNTEDGDADLDPVLEGAEIMFATVTVDAWDESAYTIMNVVAGSDNNVTIEKPASNFVIYVSGLTVDHALTLSNDNDIYGTAPSTVTTVPAGGTIMITGAVSDNGTGYSRNSKITLTDTTADPDIVTTITITQAGS